MNVEFLSGLDLDEILAARENLEAAVSYCDGPPARRIPEGLCVELAQLLQLLETAVRQRREIPES